MAHSQACCPQARPRHVRAVTEASFVARWKASALEGSRLAWASVNTQQSEKRASSPEVQLSRCGQPPPLLVNSLRLTSDVRGPRSFRSADWSCAYDEDASSGPWTQLSTQRWRPKSSHEAESKRPPWPGLWAPGLVSAQPVAGTLRFPVGAREGTCSRACAL